MGNQCIILFTDKLLVAEGRRRVIAGDASTPVAAEMSDLV